MSWNPFKAVDRALDKGSNVLHNARNELRDTTRTIRRTTSSAVSTARREARETTQAVRRTTNNFANTARREFNETAQTARKTTSRAVDTVRQANWSDVGHTALDLGGMIPVAGAAFDVAHAGWYLAKGDKVNAALSGASAIPFIGDAAMAAKYGAKAAKGVEKLAEAGNAVRKTTVVADEGVEGLGKKYTFDARTIGATPGKNLTSHQKGKIWRDMAEDPKAPLTEAQRQQIRNTPKGKGKSPAPTWDNPVTGQKEIMELSHEGKSFSKNVESGSARREHGTEVVPRWKETHAQKDKFRGLRKTAKEGYPSEKEAYTSSDGVDKIYKAFAEEVKEWGYKIDDSKLW